MASFNKVTLLGYVARDPETRYTPKGAAVATLTLGLNRKWKDESGEQREEVAFVDCTAFGRTAEVAGEYVRKGNPLLIEGRLRQETWDDKQSGQKRSKLSVVIESLVLMGGNNGKPAESTNEAPKAATIKQRSEASEPPVEDDVPF